MTLEGSHPQLTRKVICAIAVVELLIFFSKHVLIDCRLRAFVFSVVCVCVCVCVCLLKFVLTETTKCQSETDLMTNSQTDKGKLHVFTVIFDLYFYNDNKIA